MMNEPRKTRTRTRKGRSLAAVIALTAALILSVTAGAVPTYAAATTPVNGTLFSNWEYELNSMGTQKFSIMTFDLENNTLTVKDGTGMPNATFADIVYASVSVYDETGTSAVYEKTYYGNTYLAGKKETAQLKLGYIVEFSFAEPQHSKVRSLADSMVVPLTPKAAKYRITARGLKEINEDGSDAGAKDDPASRYVTALNAYMERLKKANPQKDFQDKTKFPDKKSNVIKGIGLLTEEELNQFKQTYAGYYPFTKQVTITFDAATNGGAFQGGVTENQTKSGGEDEPLSYPELQERPGYTFTGWWTQAASGEQALTVFPGADLTYYAQWNINTYTIHFEKSLTDAEGITADQTYNVELAAAKLNANGFTHAIKDFAGWSTAPDGAMEYADEAAIEAALKEAVLNSNGTLTLYAVWQAKPDVDVVFDAGDGTWNDNTTGTKTVPTTPGEKTTVPGTVTREGYEFAGWKASSASYSDLGKNDTETTAVKAGEPVTYTAQWTVKTYTITFDKNLAEAEGTTADQTYTVEDMGAKLNQNGYIHATKDFAGWSTTPDGTVEYADEAAVADRLKQAILNSNGTLSLYAVWQNKGAEDVKFDPAGGQWDDAATDVKNVPTIPGEKATVPGIVIREGYEFAGWKASSTSYGDLGKNDTETTAVKAGESVTYTAQWTAKTYTIIFDKNLADAEGSTADQTYNVEMANAKLNANGFTHATKDFVGWSLTAGGAVQFADEAAIEGKLKEAILNSTGTLELFTVWQAKPDVDVVFDPGDGVWNDNTTGIKTVPTTPGQKAAVPGTVTRPGYEFNGWKSSNESSYPNLGVADNETAVIKAGESVTYTPIWQAKEYRIQYDKNLADATGAVTEQTYVFGTTGATITGDAFSSPTKKQLGWSLNAGDTAASYLPGAEIDTALTDAMLASSGTVTLYAVWEDKAAVNMTFDAGEGAFPSGGKEQIESVRPGQRRNLPAEPSRDGYEFNGWKSDDAATYPDLAKGETQTPVAVDSKNVKYTAQWTAKTYTITFDKNLADVEGSTADQTYNVGLAAAKLNANGFTHATKDFTGWSTTPNGAVEYADEAAIEAGLKRAILNSNGTLTLYAVWQNKGAEDVKFDPAGGQWDDGATDVKNVPTIPGEKATVPGIVIREGYEFAGWKASSTSYGDLGKDDTETTAVKAGEAVTYTAQWTAKTYTITFDKNLADAEGSTADQTYNVGLAAAKLNANGFTHATKDFAGWSLTAAGAVEYADEAAIEAGLKQAILNSNGTLTLYAVWQDKTMHTVIFDPGQNGTFTTENDPLSSQNIVSGQTVGGVPAVTANTGYTFAGWKIDGTGTIYTVSEVQAMQISGDTRFVAAYTGGDPTPVPPPVVVPSYVISIDETVNGTVTTNLTRAARGRLIIITVMPDTGHTLDVLTVKDSNGKEIAVTRVVENQYIFSMPARKVTVSASFALKEIHFKDVSRDDWFYDAVQWAARSGVITDKDFFNPHAACSRAEMVTFLWRLAGSPEVQQVEHSFTDFEQDAWYAEAVMWAIAKKTTIGTSQTAFSPYAAVTRAQTVTFLARENKGESDGSSSFTDVVAGSYYDGPVAWAEALGVTNGTGNGKFSPNAECTRAQIITLLYRLYGK